MRVRAGVQTISGSQRERALGVRAGPEREQQQEARGHPADQYTINTEYWYSIREGSAPQLAGKTPISMETKIKVSTQSVLIPHDPDSDPNTQKPDLKQSPVSFDPLRVPLRVRVLLVLRL